MKRLIAILLLLLLPGVCLAWTPQTCILGPGDGVTLENPAGTSSSDNLTSTGRDADHMWKNFRWTAGGSGDAYVFGIYIKCFQSDAPCLTTPTADVASVDVTFAVYEDCGEGCTGDLKMWGYALNYDFRTIGVGRHYFDIQNVASGKNRTITAGTKYWISWRSDATPEGTEDYMFFARNGSAGYPVGVDTGVAGGMKQGVNWIATHPTFDTAPPTGVAFNTSGLDYADNYYGWSVWTASDAETPPSAQGCTIQGGTFK